MWHEVRCHCHHGYTYEFVRQTMFWLVHSNSLAFKQTQHRLCGITVGLNLLFCYCQQCSAMFHEYFWLCLQQNISSKVSFLQENIVLAPMFVLLTHRAAVSSAARDFRKRKNVYHTLDFWRYLNSWLHTREKLKVSALLGSLVMDREFNPIARWRVCPRWDPQASETIAVEHRVPVRSEPCFGRYRRHNLSGRARGSWRMEKWQSGLFREWWRLSNCWADEVSLRIYRTFFLDIAVKPTGVLSSVRRQHRE